MTSPYVFHQILQTSLADTEKTFSGLTDGCATAGISGCKLIEITGNNATGDDVKELVNNAYDVIDLLLGFVDHTDNPFVPGRFGTLSSRT